MIASCCIGGHIWMARWYCWETRRMRCCLIKVGMSLTPWERPRPSTPNFTLSFHFCAFHFLPFRPPPLTESSPGSGAGHAIEDTYILGLSLRDYFAASSNSSSRSSSPGPSPASSPSPVDAPSPIDSSLLSTYTSLYESVRLPRAQKAQLTSRQAGDVYEMQGPDFEGLASYDDCLPLVAAKLKDRMRWVWGGDLDGEYERFKKEKGISIAGVANNTDDGGSDGGSMGVTVATA
jgi:hypothetical protein